MAFSEIADIITALRRGETIILVNDSSKKKGLFMSLADRTTPQMINQMTIHGKGFVSVAMTRERAEALNLPVMENRDTQRPGSLYTLSIDGMETTTGISAFERAMTVQALLDPDKSELDFRRPGHLFPLISRDNGVFDRLHYVEASVDLAKLCEAYPMAVFCEILDQDGGIASLPVLEEVSQGLGMMMTSIRAVLEYRIELESMLECMDQKVWLMNDCGVLISEYRSKYGAQTCFVLHRENIDLTAAEYVSVKACFYSDVLHLNGQCGCKQHIAELIPQIRDHDRVIVYLREGPLLAVGGLNALDEQTLAKLIRKDLTGGDANV